MLKGIREHVEEIAALSDNMVRAHADNLVKDIEAIEREYVMIKISDVPHDLGAECLWTSLPRTVRVTATLLQKAIKEHGGKNDQ